MARVAWLLLGHLALGLGVVGIFLPLLPTTPFLLLAALAFSRSSPRLARWLHDHPRLGPPIRDWRDHGVIGRGAKLAVVAAVVLSVGGSLWLAIPWWALAVQVAILACVLLFVLTRPSQPLLREPAPGAR
ncbi:MAG: YbaN family protein [Rubellimicrobium sp.]|nr:YbaN family protein [Rubellimicrobium sp.]